MTDIICYACCAVCCAWCALRCAVLLSAVLCDVLCCYLPAPDRKKRIIWVNMKHETWKKWSRTWWEGRSEGPKQQGRPLGRPGKKIEKKSETGNKTPMKYSLPVYVLRTAVRTVQCATVPKICLVLHRIHTIEIRNKHLHSIVKNACKDIRY